MNNHRIYIFICLLLISFEVAGQVSIPERARKDQVSSKLWSALGTKLNVEMGCPSRSVITELEDQYGISSTHLRPFLIYTLNYSKDSLNIHQVMYRYPHYNEDSIINDFIHLRNLGLISKKSSSYSITQKGAEILNTYWELKVEYASSCKRIDAQQLKRLIAVVQKILLDAGKIERLNSVRLRRINRPKEFKDYPLILQANEYQKDLTALFNDNGHYRIDLLMSQTKNIDWKEISLSPLAKELLSATKNNRIYPIERCYNQVNWRVGKVGCDEAIEELSEKGLINFKSDSIYQTQEGAELFQAADHLADEQLYTAWRNVTVEEYENLLYTLEWLTRAKN